MKYFFHHGVKMKERFITHAHSVFNRSFFPFLVTECNSAHDRQTGGWIEA
jgi:hypothetical protein